MPATASNLVTVNEAQRLYVIPCGGGYSCLGFDVCREQAERYARALGRTVELPPVGSLDLYNLRAALVDEIARSGRRFECDLTPQLIGLEGKRVEVVDRDGERRRFIVGKSTGCLPIHLEVKTSRSMGGMAVTGAPFQSVRVIPGGRR